MEFRYWLGREIFRNSYWIAVQTGCAKGQWRSTCARFSLTRRLRLEWQRGQRAACWEGRRREADLAQWRNAVRRPRTAYIYFQDFIRPAVKAEKLHPSWEAKKTPEGAIQAFAGKRMVF